MKMKTKMMVAAVGMAAALTASAVTEAIAYQGRIQRTDGKPLQAVQSLSMTFQVCDTNDEDTILWSRTIPVRVGTDGNFYVELSDQNGTADPDVPNQTTLARACGNASAVQIRLKLPDSSANTKAFRETLRTYSRVDHALFAQQADEATVSTLKSDSVVVGGNLTVSGNLIVPDTATFGKVMTLDVAKGKTAELPGDTVKFTIGDWSLELDGRDHPERNRIVTVAPYDSWKLYDSSGASILTQGVSIPSCQFGKHGQVVQVPSGAEITEVQSLK